eukprot:snap_masked-scaffold_20-processed-gene-5.49-mRNA-1 protein AED:1.00 eAED:1.00 QI:0/0/0/0/1/1/2/0/154
MSDFSFLSETSTNLDDISSLPSGSRLEPTTNTPPTEYLFRAPRTPEIKRTNFRPQNSYESYSTISSQHSPKPPSIFEQNSELFKTQTSLQNMPKRSRRRNLNAQKRSKYHATEKDIGKQDLRKDLISIPKLTIGLLLLDAVVITLVLLDVIPLP